MMLDRPYLGPAREQLVEAPLPARRIVGVPEAPGGGPIKHRLDPAPDTTCRLRLRAPDRLQRLDHKPHVDGPHRQFAEHGRDVCAEGVFPLRGMLGVSPAGTVRRYV